MRARSLILFLAAAGLAVGSTVVLAGGPGHGPMGHHGMHGPLGMLGGALHRLDLTDQQRSTIKGIVEQERPAMQAIEQKIRDSRDAFRKAHPPTEFDEAAIRAQAAAIAPLMTDMAVARAKVRAQVLAVLTPEQLSKLEAMRAKWDAARGDGSTPPPPEGGPDD